MSNQARMSGQSRTTEDKMAAFLRNRADQQSRVEEQAESKVIQESQLYQPTFEDQEASQIVKFIENADKPEPKRGQSRNKFQPKKIVSSKGPARKPHQFNKLNESEKEKVFLDVYDENLKLKEKQTQLDQYYNNLQVKFQQMEKLVHGKVSTVNDTQAQNLEFENQKLKQKISVMQQVSKIQQPSRKKLISVDKTDGPTESRLHGTVTDTQIKELTKLNDLWKKRCQDQENQIRQLQAVLNSKQVSQADLTQKNIILLQTKEKQEKMDQQINQLKMILNEERKKQADTLTLLVQEKNKNSELEQQIKNLESQAIVYQTSQIELEEVKRQKRDLQEKLDNFFQTAFFRDQGERVSKDVEIMKLRKDNEAYTIKQNQLTIDFEKLKTELSIYKQHNDKLIKEKDELLNKYTETDIKLKERDQQLMPFKDIGYWDNDQFLRALGNLKLTGQEPSWRKAEFIDKQYMDSDDIQVLRKQIENLKLEKGELAANLEKAEALFRNSKELQKQQEITHQEELKHLKLTITTLQEKVEEYAKIADLKMQAKQAETMYQQHGVQYTDSVSVFDVDDEPLDYGENFFDLWIGDANYDKTELNSSFKLQAQVDKQLDISSLLTFMTVDFYDHETQHTSLAEGLACFFNLQICFKVLANGAFIQYLESNYLKIELYVSRGSEAVKVGTGLIQLKELVYQNMQDKVSKVISDDLSIYSTQNKLVGIVKFKARMRNPISQYIRTLKDRKELKLDEDEKEEIIAVRKRKLVVVIEKATFSDKKPNSFVYYSLNNEDYNTTSIYGNNPVWNYRQTHELIQNEQLVTEFKSTPMEFYIIDDSKPLGDAADKLGVVTVQRDLLLQNEMIDLVGEIVDDTDGDRVVGTLFLKIFWYELQDEEKAPQNNNVIAQSWEESVTHKIQTELRARGLGHISGFKIFDKDNDQICGYDDFVNGMKNVLSIKLNPNEYRLYYSKLPQPLNQQYFEQKFKVPSIDQSMYNQSQFVPMENIKSMINQHDMLLHDSYVSQDPVKQQITQIFQQKLREKKSKEQIFKEIDSIRPDGKIQLEELSRWLNFNGMYINPNKLKQFIDRYIDVNLDNSIDIQEFYRFITNDVSDSRPQQQQQDNRTYAVDKTLETILKFGFDKHLTLLEIRDLLDDNKNKFIEKKEFRRFLDMNLIQVSDQQLNEVVEFFDVNKDGKVSIVEFTDRMTDVNSKKRIITDQSSADSVQRYCVQYLVKYMSTKNVNLQELFNEIDQDQSATLNKDEFRRMFRNKLNIPVNNEELDTLFVKFDEDNDKKISIREFIKIMRPAIEDYNKDQTKIRQSQAQGVNTESLQRKTEDICFRYYSLLEKSFKQQADKNQSHLIKVDDFKLVLTQIATEYTTLEIEALVYSLCSFEKGLINYIQFLQFGKRRGQQQSDVFGQTGASMNADLEMEIAQNKLKQIFDKIKKAAGNINVDKIFRAFDKNSDGKLSRNEIEVAFNKMGLSKNYTKQDIDLIFKIMDKDNSGDIEQEEFIRYLK